jgi:stearoyl-CoA desaturase (delta-9 desaturase)
MATDQGISRSAVGDRFRGLPRAVNVVVVVVPFLAFVASVVLLWNDLVGWSDIAILVFMYTTTTLGITVGFHRLLTHRAFETYPWVRNTFAVLGSMAVENPVIIWVADHRQHHVFTDEEGDPHSPHLHGEGLRGALAGAWHAHIGWLLDFERRSDPLRYARDLVRDPAMRRISVNFIPLVGLGLALPFLLGLVLTWSLAGALTGMLWGGFVRIFLQHHMTFSVNSIGHMFGKRRFATRDRSTNVFWLAIPSLGDSWHHNHHAFPTAARHGLRRHEIDLSWLVVRALERLGLAWNVVRVAPEQQRAREVQPDAVPLVGR